MMDRRAAQVALLAAQRDGNFMTNGALRAADLAAAVSIYRDNPARLSRDLAVILAAEFNPSMARIIAGWLVRDTAE
jgi:hypothetical protein